MSTSKKSILIIAGILIISVIGVFLNNANNERTFSFNELLHEQFKGKEIESIFIQKFMSAAKKDYSDTHFTDKKDIEFFMQSLPEVQVRSDTSAHPEYPNYGITIRGKNQKLFLSFIISSKDIVMHDYEKKDNYSYKIANEFRLDKLEFLDPFLVNLK